MAGPNRELADFLRRARGQLDPSRAGLPPDGLRPGLYQLLDSLDGEPALVLGRRTEILAANRMARALFADFDRMPPKHRSYARWMFLDEDARALFVDWPDMARAVVESPRFEVGRDPDDSATTALVTELREQSREFDQWWAQHRVHQRTHGSKRLRHPLVGKLTVEYETLALPGDPDTTRYVYTAEPNSPSRRALDPHDPVGLGREPNRAPVESPGDGDGGGSTGGVALRQRVLA
ncbi:MmyB family transcriptional regulator [Goodfellowiella coeruleoviolacea]|nr:hypothetical protein [Goodfellowiella coeruleoviolacea]